MNDYAQHIIEDHGKRAGLDLPSYAFTVNLVFKGSMGRLHQQKHTRNHLPLDELQGMCHSVSIYFPLITF